MIPAINENKKEINKWMFITIFLTIIVLVLIRVLFFGWLEANAKLNPKPMCQQITGTPAWIENGVIIDYGAKSVSVDELIKHKTYFFYSSKCGWCNKQIESWGEEDWIKLQQAGLVVNCLEVLSE